MNKIINILITTLILLSCAESEKEVTVSDEGDYSTYLENKKEDLTSIQQQVALWTEKVKLEPRGFTFYEKLGASYHQLFEKTGKIEYLHSADSAFARAQKITQGKWKVPSLLSLSSLAIKRHDFQQAATYAVKARELTDEKFGPLLMQFDAEMELGNYKMAEAILAKNKRMDSFDYLVRLSKYKDHEGDLDSAIFYMEKASSLILDHQKERKLWSISNLADMYGHAGRIKDSYENYLKALSIDPNYDYALKGIAWVSYSHDGNTVEARKILENLQKKTEMPDYYLSLAEISEFEGKEKEAENYKNLFMAEAGKDKYEGMYNKYLIDISIERGNYDQALELAKQEVDKRPNPATHDWLAWTLFKKGDVQKAIEIYQENVEGESFEPEVIYHMGVVYHQIGETRGKKYLKESLEASYELGPMVSSDIKMRLKG